MPATTTTEPEALRTIAVEAAVAAGELLLGFARRRAEGEDLRVATKTSATDPVSEADRGAERLIADHLAAARPDDGLVGEEGGTRRSASGLTWVVDPLDGTVNFLYGHPLWSVSIACRDERGTVAGAVCHPAGRETFHAARGRGAWSGDTPLRCTSVDALPATLVGTGFSYDADVRAAQGRDVADLVPRVRDVRRGGSAALDLAFVAAGRLDAYVEAGLNAWDWAAGHLLVLEAGGVVSEHTRRLGGRDLGGIVAGGRAAHDHLTAWLGTRP